MGASRVYVIVPQPRFTTVLTFGQPNIVVDHSGHARIADFGYATIVKDEDSAVSDPDELGHTPRWTAPEIWTGETTYSKEADIFSFAMVMIEVYRGWSIARRASSLLTITTGVHRSSSVS